FPVDGETLRYLRFTDRPETLVKLVEAYYKDQGLFHTAAAPEPMFSDTVELDLATVEPSLAGPARPQDRVRLADVKKTFADALPNLQSKTKAKPIPVLAVAREIGEGSPDAPPPEPHLDHVTDVNGNGAVEL